MSMRAPQPSLSTAQTQTASSPDPIVSILVISYNTREMTLECLRSVVAETTVPYELIVMDNASTDGSAEAIAEEFPDIRFFAETENHGFAKANNMAAKEARGDYLLLLNPDTLVLDGAIDTLVGFARSTPDAKIWGGKTLWGDRTLNATSCWRRMSLWSITCRTVGLTGVFPNSSLFNSEAYGGWDRDNERRVDVVTGCFMLIPRDLWNTLGGFDLTYVMYGEEVDLCLRATKIGAAPRVTPDAVIVHYGGASQSVRSDKTIRLLRAKMTLIIDHFPWWQNRLAQGIFALWPFTRAIATGLLKRGSPSAQAWAEVWARRDEWIKGYPRQDHR